ncbi:MAG: hypothetical protein R3Y35_11545 [Clostridia bacterium]
MFKKRKSTKEIIGIEEIVDSSIMTNHGEMLYFLIKPSNLSVLSESNVSAKVQSLRVILNSLPDLEIVCLNSKENFDENKAYIEKRIEKEDNSKILSLLEKDSKNLDKIQVTMATAREFLIVFKIRKEDLSTKQNLISQIETTFKDGNFNLKLATEEDIKRFLSVYFEQNVTTEKYEKYDGELSLLRRDGTQCQRGYGERWTVNG